jgi:hypothetical protein
VSRFDLLPFSDGVLDAAAELPGAAHDAHRAAEPLLADADPGGSEPEATRDLWATAAEGRRDRGVRRVFANVPSTRVTNLDASRSWPARGFRPAYVRLHRPPGIA